MRIAVTASLTPFLRGGADYLVEGVTGALKEQGHDVELIRLPFDYSSQAQIRQLMAYCEQLDLTAPNGVRIDKLLCLQFPAYAINHPDKRLWIMHQHRPVYDLFDDLSAGVDDRDFKAHIEAFDQRALKSARAIYTIAENVAQRIKRFNGIDSTALYHPPAGEDRFYCEEPYEYIFCPSRLETLKRQDLLIRAAKLLKHPIQILIGGTGGQQAHYRQLIKELGVGDRVSLIGSFSEAEKYTLYARSLGVFFGPKDEDYGYVTLEAMLSAKPVITCADSGGPLEFIEHEHSGLVCEPTPEAVAECIDRLTAERTQARHMGQRGYDAYQRLNLSWSRVVDTLLSE